MKEGRITQSYWSKLALPVSLAVLLVVVWLGFAWSPVRGNGVEVASTNASQQVTDNVSSPVITIGVGTYLFDPAPGEWGWG